MCVFINITFTDTAVPRYYRSLQTSPSPSSSLLSVASGWSSLRSRQSQHASHHCLLITSDSQLVNRIQNTTGHKHYCWLEALDLSSHVAHEVAVPFPTSFRCPDGLHCQQYWNGSEFLLQSWCSAVHHQPDTCTQHNNSHWAQLSVNKSQCI